MKYTEERKEYLIDFATSYKENLKSRLLECIEAGKAYFITYYSYFSRDLSNFRTIHFPMLTGLSKDLYTWIVSICFLVTKCILYASFLAYSVHLIYDRSPIYDPIGKVLMGIFLFTPFAIITSGLLVSTIFLFKFLKNHVTAFFSRRTPPYVEEEVNEPTIDGTTSADEISKRYATWRIYAHFVAIFLITMVMFASTDVIQNVDENTISDLGGVLVDLSKELPPLNFIVYGIENILGLKEDSLKILAVAVFVPALVYTVPTANRLAISRLGKRNRIEEVKDEGVLKRLVLHLIYLGSVCFSILILALFLSAS